MLEFPFGHVSTMLGWNHSVKDHGDWAGVDYHLAPMNLTGVLLGFGDPERCADCQYKSSRD
jgi:hypothetical protein